MKTSKKHLFSTKKWDRIIVLLDWYWGKGRYPQTHPFNTGQRLKDKDFANWFETVWMLLNLNARWNLNEAIIPENLRHYVSAKSIGIDGNWKSNKNEVIWYLYK